MDEGTAGGCHGWGRSGHSGTDKGTARGGIKDEGMVSVAARMRAKPGGHHR